MIFIQVSVNLFLLIGLSVICFAAGLVLRIESLRAKNERIRELEKEMLRSHAEIISLCQTLDQLRLSAGRTNAPVFKLKDSPEDKSENKTDIPAEKIAYPRISRGKK